MRTAEEILENHHYVRQDPEVDIDNLINIINESRREAIEECAKKTPRYIDKESILSLISELK